MMKPICLKAPLRWLVLAAVVTACIASGLLLIYSSRELTTPPHNISAER